MIKYHWNIFLHGVCRRWDYVVVRISEFFFDLQTHRTHPIYPQNLETGKYYTYAEYKEIHSKALAAISVSRSQGDGL